MNSTLEFSVFVEEKTRLDAYLCDVLKLSRRQARNYCENNLVRVNRKPSRSGIVLKEKDIICIEQSIEAVIPGQIASNIKLEVIFKNEDFIILNKPIKTHCVRLKNTDDETIADWLAINFPQTLHASKDIRESGLVNRLDYYTSGITIAANSALAWEELRADKYMLKTYIALVEGCPRAQTIEAALENKSNSRVQISTKENIRTTELVSAKQIKFNNSIYSLVKLQGHNFSRHQIRVHLSHIGNPLVGDEMYGGKRSNILGRSGFFLHSENLKFEFKDELFNFSAESDELKALLAK